MKILKGICKKNKKKWIGEISRMMAVSVATMSCAASTALAADTGNNTFSALNEGVGILQKMVYWLATAFAIFGVIKIFTGWNNNDHNAQTAGLKLVATGAGIALVGATLIPMLEVSAAGGLSLIGVLSMYLAG